MRVSLFAATLVLAPAIATAAHAGDAAKRTLIGFSNDGATFAFMESGVQDGSGFPYATVYLVDVAKDAFAEPPVQVMLRDGSASEGEGAAVARAMDQAAPALKRHGVSTPARLLWSQPITEASDGDPDKHGAYPGAAAAYFTDGREGPFELKLQEFDAPDGKCADYGADVKGFAMTVKLPTGEPHEIYRDGEVPESRGCAMGYSLSDVMEGPLLTDGRRPLIVLVNVFRHGFEGWDRRFIAVPMLPEPPAAQ